MKVVVGAVIVTYKSEAEIAACIDSVYAQTPEDITIKVIVVDNNSGDKSVAIAQNKKASVVRNSQNLGFAKAVNIGIKRAYELNCDHILLLNPDATIRPGSISAMLRTLHSDNTIGGVSPDMIHSDGTSASSGYYLKTPSLLTITCFSTRLRPWALKQRWLIERYEEQDLTSQKTVHQLPGACILTSREKFDVIGLLDEDFAIWFEDVEWSYRARKKGYQLVFCPDAQVVHDGGISFAKWMGLEKSVTFYVSMKTFFRKHKPFSCPAIVLVLCINALGAYFKGRDKDQLRFIIRLLTQKRGNLPT